MFEDVKIDWDVFDEYDDAGDGHTTFHEAEGIDDDGNEYTATAVLVDGELEEIEDIEKIEK